MCKPHRRTMTGRGSKAGYTLTEMLVVIAVIGLIAAFLTPNLLAQLGRAKSKTAQLQLNGIAGALTLYRDDVGHYPTQAEGLAALTAEPPGATGWTGPYQSASSLRDPWGQPILYSLNTTTGKFQVKSLGADDKPGGRGADRDLEAPEP